MIFVYQVVTVGSDGSTRRHLPLYTSRRQASDAALAHADNDPKYNQFGGRWKVKIERLPLETAI